MEGHVAWLEKQVERAGQEASKAVAKQVDLLMHEKVGGRRHHTACRRCCLERFS